MVSEKNIFSFIPHYKTMADNDAPGACMEPRDMIGTIYKEGYCTLLHTKFESSGPCGFGAEDFPHCKYMEAVSCHGNHNFDTIC